MNQSQEHSGEENLDFLLEAAKQGSSSARNELFSRLQAYLNFVASQHRNSSLQAKLGQSDVVQETLLMANREFARFRGTTVVEFRGWLRQILINAVRSANRHYTTSARNFRKERELSSPSPHDSDGRYPAEAGLTPSREVMASEEIQRIAEMLGKLPTEMRQVIHLRNWEQLQFNEIAERMGITLSQAAKLWYEALQKLQKLVAEAEND